MKVIGVIPARYKSSRLEGKPLKDICGKPMIWWVYQKVLKVKEIDEVYVATDDERIMNTCKELNIKAVMTRDDHKMMLERVWEVSEKIPGDIYVSIAGDEPLIEPENIAKVIKPLLKDKNLLVSNLKTKITNPVDLVNWTTMKVVCNEQNDIILASRSPIPYPKATTEVIYYKHMGTYALRKEALNFFYNKEKGSIESIEDFDLLRFLENHITVRAVEVKSQTVSVDTPKDLERVRDIINKNMNR